MRYALIPVRMAIIKKKRKIRSIAEDMEKKELWYSVGGNVNITAIMKNSMEVPQIIKNRTTI